LAGVTQRSVTVDAGGRGGYVTYSDPSGVLTFVWEGANFGYEVMVPSPEHWEEQTGLPLAIRDDTLEFIAQCFIKQRSGRGATFAIVEQPYAALQIRA
jgi:hypothetical protein